MLGSPSYGEVSILTVLIKTSFSTSDQTAEASDDFAENRLVIARLATARGINITTQILTVKVFLKVLENNRRLLPAFCCHSGTCRRCFIGILGVCRYPIGL
jgi:hypothetical protein